MKCGLLGRKLGHSYSPQIHGYLGKYSYDLFEKEPKELEAFLKNGAYSGLNVTIPYKKEVIPFLNELTPRARALGAVNTIIRKQDGTLLGHNTDYFGFSSMVQQLGISFIGKKVLVLGSGGASNTAVTVLNEMQAHPIVISRSGINNYENLSLHNDAAAIVNTTPVGMYPNTGITPLELTKFPQLEAVLDVVYNPARTRLLMDAEKLGIPHINGLWMLVAQAKEAAEYFTGTPIPDSEIGRIYRLLRKQMENIILIGMPGSGKSTIAKILAEKKHMICVDSDTEIETYVKKAIPAIFQEDGETAFRQYETHVLNQLGKGSAQIIATGGGCVTQERNYPLLHQNGRIFWIRRDLDSLPKEGRPLSLKNDLASMFRTREPLYRSFADFIVENNQTPEDAANKILAILEEEI